MDAQTKQAQVQGDIQIKLKELTIKQADLKVRAFQAETDRYKAEILAAEAKANIQGKEPRPPRIWRKPRLRISRMTQ